VYASSPIARDIKIGIQIEEFEIWLKRNLPANRARALDHAINIVFKEQLDVEDLKDMKSEMARSFGIL
jgi:hypothetical protein